MVLAALPPVKLQPTRTDTTVVLACQILNDNATRGDYDYALAHPEEHMLNQYRYYRNRCLGCLTQCAVLSCSRPPSGAGCASSAGLCWRRVYRQMKVPWQITLTGVVLLCSVLHYITKQQMYENVRFFIFFRSSRLQIFGQGWPAGQRCSGGKPVLR